MYVKQPNNELSCHFHQHIHSILKGIEDLNQPETIKVAYDPTDKLSLLIVNFWDFQFSFQSTQFNNQVQKLSYRNNIKWDGIRKQKCAASIFHFAIENRWISNKTMGGEDFRLFIENEVEHFLDGDYHISGGRFVKIKNIKPAVEKLDYYRKNYIREKLFKCQDRPVIISAVFKKVWSEHVTFVCVKPFIPHTKVISICNHINLYRNDIEKFFKPEDFIFEKRYYIIGYCRPYRENPERMGVILETKADFIPIFGIKEYEKMPANIVSKCHRFSVEDYVSPDQQWLKL